MPQQSLLTATMISVYSSVEVPDVAALPSLLLVRAR
jgi:hypothetical protein